MGVVGFEGFGVARDVTALEEGLSCMEPFHAKRVSFLGNSGNLALCPVGPEEVVGCRPGAG